MQVAPLLKELWVQDVVIIQEVHPIFFGKGISIQVKELIAEGMACGTCACGVVCD
jgi:hypothetical protein